VVAINTIPNLKDSRKSSLQKWITRTQSKLAFRSRQSKNFHQLRSLFLTKRLIDVAIENVLGNAGAKTPGIDGMTKKDLKAESDKIKFRNEIYEALKQKSYKPSPVRRVYIPKPNGKRRPLGIPTIKDRVVQEMLKLVLEPIYETQFYAHSYGFRPYRCTHHAAVRIHDLTKSFRGRYRWIIEGDISKCFDKIPHDILMRIIGRRIKDGFILRVIKDQLKAGIMEKEQFYISEKGTPQGGIASPLLANIYLHELDMFIANRYEYRSVTEQKYHKISTRYFGSMPGNATKVLQLLWDGREMTLAEIANAHGKVPSTYHGTVKMLKENGLIAKVESTKGNIKLLKITSKGKTEYHKARISERIRNEIIPCHMIRYADDFVVMVKTEDDAVKLRDEIETFLNEKMRLKLSREKTRITHTNEGFDFLGFQIKTYPNYRKGACLIRPANDKIKNFKRKIKAMSKVSWKSGRNASDIGDFNLLIRSWGNYYRRVSSSATFRDIDYYIWHRVFRDTFKVYKATGMDSRRKHYRKNYIPYRMDIRPGNRWRRGKNFGKWADRKKTAAHIIMRMSFMPIEYVNLHPQLNPFFDKERERMDEDKRLKKILHDAKQLLPDYNYEYGADWLNVRLEALRRYNGRCAVCQKILRTIRFGKARLIGHHIIALKVHKKSDEANLLENVIPLCPKCHSKAEKV